LITPDFPTSFKGILDNCLQGIPTQNDGKKFILNNGKSCMVKMENLNPFGKGLLTTVVGLVLYS